MSVGDSRTEKVLATPALGNVASITNFVGMGALAFFLNGSATQQLTGLNETREALARIEVRVAGIETLREELAAMRKEFDQLRGTAARATEVQALEDRIADLHRRLEAAEACVRDRRRCR